MTRYLLTFTAGATTTAATVFYLDGRLKPFLFGALLVLLAELTLLASPHRMRRGAAILADLAKMFSPERVTSSPAVRPPAPITARPPAPKPPPPIRTNDRETIDIQSALVNFGMHRGQAKATAIAAVEAGGTFEEKLGRAIRGLPPQTLHRSSSIML